MSAFLRKYNTATHVYIPMVKRGVVDFAVGADWTPANGDVKVVIDGGAAANIGTLPTAIAMGNAAVWDFTIANTEVAGKKITVSISDSATKAVEDNMFLIETYGHASAEYASDPSVAAPSVTLADGVTHGGTTALLQLERVVVASTTSNQPGIKATGNGTAAGLQVIGGATGNGLLAQGGATSGSAVKATGTAGNAIALELAGQGSAAGMKVTGGGTGAALNLVGGGTSGDGLLVTTTSGHGFSITATGTSKHGAVFTGGDGGTSDGVKAVAGTGGVDLRAAITGNLTGAVSGAVGSVTGAVGSVTGNVGGNVTGSVGSVAAGGISAASFAAGAIDAAAIAANAIGASELAADAVAEIQSGLATTSALAVVATDVASTLAAVDTEVAAIKAKTDLIPGTQDGYTFAQLQALIAAVLLGKASGLGTSTAVFRSANDSKDRVTATVDADGNRTAVTLDAT